MGVSMESRCTCGTVLAAGTAYCPNCGRMRDEDTPRSPAVPEDGLFCPHCGSTLAAEEVEQVTPEPEPVEEFDTTTEPGPKPDWRGTLVAYMRAARVPALVAICISALFITIDIASVSVHAMILMAAGFATTRIVRRRFAPELRGADGAWAGAVAGLQHGVVFTLWSLILVVQQGIDGVMETLLEHPDFESMAPQIADFASSPGFAWIFSLAVGIGFLMQIGFSACAAALGGAAAMIGQKR